MDAFLLNFGALQRYILAVFSILILFRCVFSLFRLKPRREVMATLTNLADDSTIEIDCWETSIGRSRSCDISLRAYKNVSRFHAVLALRKDGWHIFDTGSKTGLFINGQQIKSSAKIENGDTISFGAAAMKFISNGYGEDNCINDFTNATRLVNLSDNSAFYPDGPVIFGRDKRCGICLPMKNINSYHAEIYPTKEGWMISDLNSEDGTYLNGNEVFGSLPLYDGDIINIGDYSFMFKE